MKKIFVLVLLLSVYALGQSTLPSAQPPQAVDSTDLTSAQLTLLSTATAGGTCHASAHVWCVPNTAGTNLLNGAALKAAFGHHGDASGASATGNIEHGASVDGEVIVLTANDGGANHQYESGTGSAPFAVGGGCFGNNTNAYNDGTCNFYFGPLVQPNPSAVKPIIITTTHYGSLPAQGHRVIPITGDGISSPAGQSANVSVTDFATIQSSNSNPIMVLSQNDTNGVRFVGIEFTSTSHTGPTIYSQGFTYSGTRALGNGITGSRALYIKDGATNTYLSAVARIQSAHPVISEAHVVPSTPCSQTWTQRMSLSTPTLVCIVGQGTNWVAGQSTLTVVYNAQDYPAADITINAMASGSGSGQCAAGATNAGNDTQGNICVVDSTHAYFSVTMTPTTPANGGVHNFYVDTYPIGGGSYTAGTEHTSSDFSLIGTYPQAWTLTCTDCPIAPTGGRVFVPVNSTPYTFVAQGTVGGPTATNWTSSHRLVLGIGSGTPLVPCTGVNVPRAGCIAPVTDTVNQTITAKYYETTGGPMVETSAVVANGTVPIGSSTPTSGEIDVLYKIITTHYASTKAIVSCGNGMPYGSNYVVRGGTYTLTCTGVGTGWTSALNCSGTCGTTNLNLGSDITINSISVASTTSLTFNFTVASNAEVGARHVIWDRVWLHGSDGQAYRLSSTPGNLIPCMAPGDQPLQDCYIVNAIDMTSGILPEGAHDAVIESYVNAIHNNLNDSQAIAQTQGDGPLLIRNNFLSSSTENIFIGGGGGWMNTNGAIASHDVTVVGNYIYKPPLWRNGGVSIFNSGQGQSCVTIISTPTGNHYNCVWQVKNLIESKGISRGWVHQNVMENNWVGATAIYSANVFTPRNGNAQGTIADSINDTLIENNLVVGIHNSISRTDYDVNVGYTASASGGFDPMVNNGSMPAVQSRRNIIRNNLYVINQNSTNSNYGYKLSAMSFNANMRDLLVENNTHLPATGVVLNNLSFVYGGPYFNVFVGANCASSQATTNNMWVRNNVVFMGVQANSGCHPEVLMQNPTSSGNAYSDRFRGNVLPQPGTGTAPVTTYYSTLPSGGIPTVASLLSPLYPQLNQSQPFSLDYTLSGPLPTLATWIGTNSNTSNGATSGVNMAPIQAMAIPVMQGLPLDSPGPIITSASLPNAAVAEAYTFTLTATGGTTPYTWSVASGSMTVCPSLTNGLCLDGTSGTISGTPVSSGSLTFTARVTDAVSLSGTRPFTLTINPALSISTATIPTGTVSHPYSTTINATGGTTPYTWSVASGSMTVCPSLTDNLCLNSASGAITGTPTTVATLNFTARVVDPGAASATQPLSLVIGPTVSIVTNSLPDGRVGSPYSQGLSATGGVTPYTWSLVSGTLCDGLTLSSGGVIFGTPTTQQSCSFTVGVLDSLGDSATAPLTINIQPSGPVLTIDTTSFTNGRVTISFLQPLAASGGTPPYTWDIAGGSLPPGLAVVGSFISGVPSQIGTFSFTPRVTDSVGTMAQTSSPLTITIDPLAGSNTGAGIFVSPKVVVK